MEQNEEYKVEEQAVEPTPRIRGEYQVRQLGVTKDKIVYARLSTSMYNKLNTHRKNVGWTWSRILAESVEWYMGIQPMLYEAQEKLEQFEAENVVYDWLKARLEEYLMDLQEALDEQTGLPR